ncbi:MAG: hypothetical protein A2710_23285 [Burkholderiales bacterium RIFCSPHIGHO2_01_FULL_64_960]|nr:MAG: hypothetical protein A2710_23285 [Burkholderiales bacterium RIFCSPHIGHO2_01_FULL_64_960]
MTQPARPDEIVTAVREVLDGLAPLAAGRANFDARVASRLLVLLQRELALGEAARVAEQAGLRALLPAEGEDAPVEALRARLCERIASAVPGIDEAELLAHLWRTALAQLAINSPGYPYAS